MIYGEVEYPSDAFSEMTSSSIWGKNSWVYKR